MKIHVQYNRRGDIILIWQEDPSGESHAFVAPQQGYASTEVEAPAGMHRGQLETIQASYRVQVDNGQPRLVAR